MTIRQHHSGKTPSPFAPFLDCFQAILVEEFHARNCPGGQLCRNTVALELPPTGAEVLYQKVFD